MSIQRISRAPLLRATHPGAFPEAILVGIFRHMSADDALGARAVCKTWQAITDIDFKRFTRIFSENITINRISRDCSFEIRMDESRKWVCLLMTKGFLFTSEKSISLPGEVLFYYKLSPTRFCFVLKDGTWFHNEINFESLSIESTWGGQFAGVLENASYRKEGNLFYLTNSSPNERHFFLYRIDPLGELKIVHHLVWSKGSIALKEKDEVKRRFEIDVDRDHISLQENWVILSKDHTYRLIHLLSDREVFYEPQKDPNFRYCPQEKLRFFIKNNLCILSQNNDDIVDYWHPSVHGILMLDQGRTIPLSPSSQDKLNSIWDIDKVSLGQKSVEISAKGTFVGLYTYLTLGAAPQADYITLRFGGPPAKSSFWSYLKWIVFPLLLIAVVVKGYRKITSLSFSRDS